MTMRRGDKKNWVGLTAAMLMLLISVIPAQARIAINGAECAYTSTCSASGGHAESAGKANAINALSIENLIINGAASMLESYANTLIFMNHFELSDISGYNSAFQKNNYYNALEKIEKAIAIYDILIAEAQNASYNASFIGALKNLDYDRLKNANKLNASVFLTVRRFLQPGDVTGAIAYMHKLLLQTRESVYAIQDAVEKETLPTNTHVWDINNKFAEMILFGQYCAEVFYTAKETLYN